MSAVALRDLHDGGYDRPHPSRARGRRRPRRAARAPPRTRRRRERPAVAGGRARSGPAPARGHAARSAARCPAGPATTGTSCRAWAIPTRRPSRPPFRSLAALHDELWSRTGSEPGADRARRLLDGLGDELLARVVGGAACARGHPRLLRFRARGGGMEPVARGPPLDARVHRARSQRPDHGGRLRAPGPRAARGRRARGRVPRVRCRPPHRPRARAGRRRLARRDARARRLSRCGSAGAAARRRTG